MLSTRRLRYLICYAVVAALGMYTHLSMVFVVTSHAVLIGVLMILPGTRKNIQWQRPAMAFLLTGVLALLFYFPLLWDIHHFFLEKNSSLKMATPQWALLEILRGLEIGLGTSLAVSATGLLLLVGGWSYFRQSPFAAGIFVAPGILMMASAVVLHRPTFPRFFFFLIGFGLLILTRGAMRFGGVLSRRPGHSKDAAASDNPLGVFFVLVMLIASLFSLGDLYRYPKQDFEQAMQFVNRHAQKPDIVVTVGLAKFPYLRYYQQPWESVNTLAELEALRMQGQRVWVVYTLLNRIKGTDSDFLHALEHEFTTVRVFPGTLSGGEIIVGRAEPIDLKPQ